MKLAVSVNAGDDATRERIMPVNRKYPLTELARALAAFPLARGRRITLEYVLLPGVNDSKEQAMGLASFARKFPSKINLIPFNPAPGAAYRRPTDIEVERFRMWLINKGFTAIVRSSKGPDIMAACGQLAHDRLAGEYEP